ncbi:MAG TPA: MBL fold metallo-hydrolase [Candidatus Ozemobacteraceae bacterium]|nr:MBL fold metallo-hydrolase [Candidatus Ozemobacteraceae bacterium]
MLFEQIPVGGMGNFAYLFADREGGEACLVDPAHQAEKLLARVKELKLNVTRVLLTHHHFDHLNAAMTLKARTGAKLLAHAETARLAAGSVSVDDHLSDGDSFILGGETVHVLHTPGHAPGSLCFVVGGQWLITGDTLFVGNCGRTDLPGGDPRQLFASLQRLKQLPDSLVICSGHDYGLAKTRTLGEEKKLSAVLKAATFAEFDAIP